MNADVFYHSRPVNVIELKYIYGLKKKMIINYSNALQLAGDFQRVAFHVMQRFKNMLLKFKNKIESLLIG